MKTYRDPAPHVSEPNCWCKPLAKPVAGGVLFVHNDRIASGLGLGPTAALLLKREDHPDDPTTVY